MGRRLLPIPHALVVLSLCLTAAAACLAVRAPAAVAADPEQRGDVLFPPDGASMALARRLADQHWGAAACGGAVTLAWTPLAPGTNAVASWSNPTDAWDNAGENFDCRIDFNPGSSYDWPKLCTVVVHEVGHLLGRRHAEDSEDVMSAFYARPLPLCQQTPDPAASADGPGPQPAPAPARSATQRVRTVQRPRSSSARARHAMRCRVARRILGARRAARSKLRCRLPRGPRRTFLRR